MERRAFIQQCGAQVVRLAESSIGGEPTELLLNSLGFYKLDDVNVSLCHRVRRIDIDEATSIIARMLYRDLAYNSAGKATKEDCLEFALDWLDSGESGSANYYTNGSWLDYWQSGRGDWLSLTNATFDGGVIEVNEHYSRCIWFEAED